MAEKLKVFMNQTLTAADIINGNEFQLAATTTTSQAVIKDIYIDLNNSNVKGVIKNNNYEILSSISSANGTEVVDKSTAITANINPIPSTSFGYHDLSLIMAPTTAITKTTLFSTRVLNNNYYVLPNVVPQPTEATTDTSQAAFNAHVSFVYITDSGTGGTYYYTDGNSTTAIYISAASGGVTSAWNTLSSISYTCAAVDIDNEIVYYLEGTSIFGYDIGTQTQTLNYVTKTVTSASSYSRMCVSNGNIFIWATSGASLVVYNISSGTEETFSAVFLSSGVNSIGVTYNKYEDIYYMISSNPSENSIYRFNITTGEINNIYSLSNLTEAISTGSGPVIGGDTEGNFSYINTASNPVVINVTKDIVTQTFTNSALVTLSTSSGVLMKTGATQTPLALSDYDIKLTARVTGVEITGV